jgi:enolase-phosphatase E1
VSSDLGATGVKAVLLDIEGTTTPIAFVYGVLFPFARAHLTEFIAAHAGSPAVSDLTRVLRAEHAADQSPGEPPPPWSAGVATYALWLMDRDRKSPGLKGLQGLVWEEGYQAGQLQGQVFPDVPAAIRRWRQAGLDVAIYSSGSELAQRRLFESTEHGDLAPLLSGFFDTAVGAKTSAESYARVAKALGCEPRQVLFISDVTAELVAARTAGLQTRLSIRPGNPPQPGAESFESVTTFETVR